MYLRKTILNGKILTIFRLTEMGKPEESRRSAPKDNSDVGWDQMTR